MNKINCISKLGWMGVIWNHVGIKEEENSPVGSIGANGMEMLSCLAVLIAWAVEKTLILKRCC